LDRLELEAERESNYLRLEAMISPLKPQPVSTVKRDRTMIRNLQHRTFNINMELQAKRELAVEQERYVQATMELKEMNLTSAERKALKLEIERGQIIFSKLCPELHPDWRIAAQAAFDRKKI
jgi:hypothetical protein